MKKIMIMVYNEILENLFEGQWNIWEDFLLYDLHGFGSEMIYITHDDLKILSFKKQAWDNVWFDLSPNQELKILEYAKEQIEKRLKELKGGEGDGKDGKI